MRTPRGRRETDGLFFGSIGISLCGPAIQDTVSEEHVRKHALPRDCVMRYLKSVVQHMGAPSYRLTSDELDSR